MRPIIKWRRAARDEKPSVILSAASLEAVAKWRETNAWSETVPLVLFGGIDLEPFGLPFQATHGDGVPYRVENAPSEVWTAWNRGRRPSTEVPLFRSRLQTYMRFARQVANLCPKGNAWVLFADADSGALAMAVATARGGTTLALSATAPDTLAAALALDHKIDLRASIDVEPT